jgi:hypothetical protein
MDMLDGEIDDAVAVLDGAEIECLVRIPATCSGRGVTGRTVVLPCALVPGCRFAGRIIERTSGKLADVWSPDAVNDVRGRDDCAVFVAPRRPGAGCRFAGRLIPRTSGKLANVWSPDAMNHAGGSDDCAIFVMPRRRGRSSEHGHSDQC